MTEKLPLSLFHTGRAQCPDCGAGLALSDHGALVQCQYCGGTGIVQRRLRTIEPVISDGFVTADAPLGGARNVRPSQIIDAVAQDESHCPACGVELESDQIQAIRTCQHCGAQSKIERRLLRSPDADEALEKKDQDPAEQRRFAATEQLIVAIETETDFTKRVKAGWELGEMWIHVNARAARLLPRVLRILQTADDRLAILMAELIGKLLCSHDIILANAVLRTAEKFTFDVNGSQILLWQLGLGSGSGLKLLLDTADYAASRGATEYACSALWGANMMIERHYADRMRLAEIVLYRLLYLKGPVQAWAIELAKGQLGLGCRFPTPTLLHFMDDCAAERPELLPHIRKCFYDGLAATEQEWTQRLQLVPQLLTAPAKIAALEHLYVPPATMDEPNAAAALSQLLEMTHDEAIGAGAISAIASWIEDDNPLRECVHTMVRTFGDKLPEEIRRAYLRQVPKSPLLSAVGFKNWNAQAEPRSAFDEQLDEWLKMWRAGINAAFEKQQRRQAEARGYWKEIRTSSKTT